MDWTNREYRLDCGDGEETIMLDGGKYQDPRGPEFGVVDVFEVQFADLDGDRFEDALVHVLCVTGRINLPHAMAFSTQSGTLRQLGQVVRAHAPEPQGLGYTTTDPVYATDDPLCCPSVVRVRHWELVTGEWRPTEDVERPADHQPA